jgi:hypothetical protein
MRRVANMPIKAAGKAHLNSQQSPTGSINLLADILHSGNIFDAL